MMFGMNSWWSQGTHVCWNHHASVNMPWFILHGRSPFSNPLYLPVLEMCWDRHSISGRPNSPPNPLWLGSDGRKLALSFLFFWPFCGCISAWKYLICWLHLGSQHFSKKHQEKTIAIHSESYLFVLEVPTFQSPGEGRLGGVGSYQTSGRFTVTGGKGLGKLRNALEKVSLTSLLTEDSATWHKKKS